MLFDLFPLDRALVQIFNRGLHLALIPSARQCGILLLAGDDPAERLIESL
jgi:hypothetical protein